MNFDELKKGDFLYFRYDPTIGVYIYINNITSSEVEYDELRILHRKLNVVYSFGTIKKSLWNHKDFIFNKLEKCNEDVKILIEYIFKYSYKEIK